MLKIVSPRLAYQATSLCLAKASTLKRLSLAVLWWTQDPKNLLKLLRRQTKGLTHGN
jgi:hypothetical protein